MKKRNRKNIEKNGSSVQMSINGMGKNTKTLIRCAFLEGEIKNKVARTFDAMQLKKKLLGAVDILKKKAEGMSINEIAGMTWGRSWVKEITADYIEDELDSFILLPQPKVGIKPISVSYMDYYKHKVTWKFEEDEIVAVLEGLDEGLSTRKIAISVGSNTEAIIKLEEVLDKKGIDLSNLNEVGGDVDVRNKWDSINKGSSRRVRSDEITVKGCFSPLRY